MAKIEIGGVEYDLRMSLWASEQIEKEFGDLKNALQKFRKERKVTMVKWMFRTLANACDKSTGTVFSCCPAGTAGDDDVTDVGSTAGIAFAAHLCGSFRTPPASSPRGSKIIGSISTEGFTFLPVSLSSSRQFSTDARHLSSILSNGIIGSIYLSALMVFLLSVCM